MSTSNEIHHNMLDGPSIGSLAARNNSAPSHNQGTSSRSMMCPRYEKCLKDPNRIVYRVKSDQVDVLAVVHGAQLLPPES